MWLSNQGDDYSMSGAQRRRLSGSCGLGAGAKGAMEGAVCWGRCAGHQTMSGDLECGRQSRW
eukprot:scaffold17742_cov80-Phaeocystis_antarctica.AAC.2